MKSEQLIIGDVKIPIHRDPRRKRAALKIRNAAVSLHLPPRFSLKLAQQFVAQHHDWIIKQLNTVSSARNFAEHSLHPLYGVEYPLIFAQSPKTQPHIELLKNNFVFYYKTDSNELTVKRALAKFYRREAEHYLYQRTQQLAEQTHLKPSLVKIRSYHARWACCNARGEVFLNWQLIQMPKPVIDYVIIHELCHLKELNHSQKFWQLVAYHQPDYAEHRTWLRANPRTF